MQYLTHRHRLTAGLLAAVASFALLCRAEAQSIESPLAGSKPNILVILTDDQGYGDTSGHGHPNLKTPNLDRLEREGHSFKNFFVSPTCSPTRSALMTGRHEFFNGVTHTILERERLTLDAITIAQVLQQAGYRTGAFGKWHLGDEDPYQPNQRGFDESFIHGGGGIGQTFPGSCGDAPGNRYFNPTISHNGVFEKTQGYCTDVFFDRAQKFIASTQAQSDKQPFFCWLATNAPHDPYNAKPEDAARFASLDVDDKLKNFYGMIENIDSNVGFMSDNGMTGGGSGQVGRDLAPGYPFYNAAMKGLKGSNDEGGARVPFFVRWTGKVEAGRAIDRIAAHLDVLPTLAALAGAPLPEGQVEGRSLLPLLEGKTDRWEDRYLFNHVCRWPTGADPGDFRNVNFSVRNQKYRYVAAQGGGGATKGKGKDKGKKGAPAAPRGPELFDMETDPGQTTNVIDRHPEIAAQMKAAFDHYWTEAIPLMVNEKAPMSPTKPYHEWYREQEAAGGIPEWVAPAL